MNEMSVSEARKALSDTINKVAFGGERVLINRHGKVVAALVSAADLEILELIEDQWDIEAVKEALESPKDTVSWDVLKKELDAKHGISDYLSDQ